MSIETMIKSIQGDAIASKGAYVPYSQCLQPTKSLIETLPYTKDGICNALAAKWIAEHANGGSLWNWLFAAGTTNVQQAKIANLMINFTESVGGGKSGRNTTVKTAATGVAYQQVVTTKYLGLYGVKKRSIAQSWITGDTGNLLDFGLGPKVGMELANRLQPKWMVTKSGTYVLIGVLGKGGHAMAAHVGDDVAFFDPNFGEFYFPTTGDFQNFFKKFWPKSSYQKSFSKFFLHLYAKGV